MEHLIELRDVYKIYQMGAETVHALDGISLTVDRGEFVAIVGTSGSPIFIKVIPESLSSFAA